MGDSSAELDQLRLVSEIAYRLATTPKLAAQFSSAELEGLRDDVVGEELASKGFGPEWKPTTYGLLLEGLIDLINRELFSREAK